MTPSSPVLKSGILTEQEIKIAENQPEYQTLPALPLGDGVILTRWELSDDEIAEIVKNKSIYLFMWTFNKPVTPILLQVTEPQI